MVMKESRRLIRKLLLLGTLVACLGVVSSGVGTKAVSAVRGDKRLPCCSVCEPDPTIPICRHGCIEGC